MSKLAAEDWRMVGDPIGFAVIMSDLRDVDSGIHGAEIKLRRFAIDGSVLIVATSYDDGVAAIALTKEQAEIVGEFFRR